ncbi:hypothetical protein FE257_000273 [Aspergillus nanangensis]|uniref:START domain-containing protein n=1 Tax=Aspergillus nanangensis TaxID=2582783 RepID=A0AAD4D0U6_ASPNN|nr:hypothetical protein FE257_000273 [Aspergillus nanangensis]
MAALQEALECLSPTSWDDVPKDPDGLRTYLNDISTKAHLIVDSIPEQPSPESTDSSSSSSSSLRYEHTNPSSPSSRMRPSPARFNTTDSELQSLHREWGKPIRVTSAKDNPFEILIHKTPGKDGKGHWFGRRSVHEGMSFARWRSKLSTEMIVTLQANQERMRKGRMPDQSVRGIGAEKMLEEIEVRDVDGVNVVGYVHVFHVSAQFPKPTTPRDFVTLILSWDAGVRGMEGGRNWMMVSRPCLHPDGPEVGGYIRGEYESVEFIREVSPSAAGNGAMGAGRSGEKVEEEEDISTPVEWVMVTRSDPGGSIPRWMVEKGTPKSICADAVKFLDWACRDEALSRKRSRSRSTNRHESQHRQIDGTTDEEGTSDSEVSSSEVEHHGLIASFAYLVNAGLERYAPQAVLEYLPGHSRQLSRSRSNHRMSLHDGDVTPRTSAESTALSQTPKSPVDHANGVRSPSAQGGRSTPSLIVTAEDGHHEIPPMEMMKMNKKGEKLSSHEKNLAKLVQKKRDIEIQLDKVRQDISSLHLPAQDEEFRRDKASTPTLAALDPGSDQVSSSATSSIHRPVLDDRSRTSTPEPSKRDGAKLQKVASGLFHEESKLLKRLGKIEKDQFKEASKIQAQQQKHADRDEKSRHRAENECLRHEVDVLKKEIDRLRTERQQWLNLVGSLQSENARLAARVGEAK